MDKKNHKIKFNISKIIIALLLCFFCATSFVGCVGRIGGGGSSSGGSSGGGSSSGSGSGGSGGSSSDDEFEDLLPSDYIKDMNDVILGVIGVYEVDKSAEVFYDKYQEKMVSYSFVAERQFTTMATYIYKTLTRIYGSPDLTGTSFSIANYGGDKSVTYSNVINTDVHKTLAGISNSTYTNSERLNYKNAISGGYAYEKDGDEYKYSISAFVTANQWKAKAIMDSPDAINKIAGNLAYIYNNLKTVSSADSEITFTTETSTLKTAYNGFSTSSTIDYSKSNSLGITKEFLWNVAYYVAYSLIGETNMNNSINNHNNVFSGNSIQSTTLDDTTKVYFENYKGYHIVIKELITNLGRMYINGSSMSFVDSFDNVEWDKTPFPKLNKNSYEFYDNISEVADSNSKEFDKDLESDPGVWEDNVEEKAVEPGTSRRLKELIILPYINTDKYDANFTFDIGSLMLGFSSVDDDSLRVQTSVKAKFNDGSYSSDNFEKMIYTYYEEEQDFTSTDGPQTYELDYIKIDKEFYSSKDIVDGSLNFDKMFGSISEALKEIVENSFHNQDRKVTYSTSGENKTQNIGFNNVYNELDVSTLITNNNIIDIKFSYFDNSNTALSVIPKINIMSFDIFEDSDMDMSFDDE